MNDTGSLEPLVALLKYESNQTDMWCPKLRPLVGIPGLQFFFWKFLLSLFIPFMFIFFSLGTGVKKKLLNFWWGVKKIYVGGTLKIHGRSTPWWEI